MQKTGSQKSRMPKTMEWSNIRIFLAVAEHGSLSGAAKQLGINQSTVSRRISELEQELGAALMHRSGGGAQLTELGQEIVRHAAIMERGAAAIEAAVARNDDREAGEVHIAAPDGLAAFWMAPRLAELHAEAPQLRIKLDSGLWPGDPLGNPCADLTLSFDRNEHPDAVAQPLASLHYCLFASREYIERRGLPKTAAEVPSHCILHHVAQSRQPEGWDRRSQALQQLSERGLETNSSAVILMATRSGAGIAALPSAVLEFAPELVMVLPEPVARLRLYLLRPRREQCSAKVRRTIEWIESIFDPERFPWWREDFTPPAPLPTPELEQNARNNRLRKRI